MQVTSGNTSMQMTSAENTQRPPRPDGPPPKGGVPPGLETAVSTLSDDQQQLTTDMLSSLTDEQQESLKSMLDELKPLTEGLSHEDTGSIFFEALNSIYNGDNTETANSNSTSVNVDIYA
jgi:ADP-ribosylglycohydrolase